MNRPITTLFMLESLDGKISSGSSDNLDVDKDSSILRIRTRNRYIFFKYRESNGQNWS